MINQRTRAIEITETETEIKIRVKPTALLVEEIIERIIIEEISIPTENQNLKMNRLIYLFLCACIFMSCTDTPVISEYKSLSGAVWNKDDVKEFTFSEMDSLKGYNVFINVRNDQNFPYSNLFLIASLHTPDGEVMQVIHEPLEGRICPFKGINVKFFSKRTFLKFVVTGYIFSVGYRVTRSRVFQS